MMGLAPFNRDTKPAKAYVSPSNPMPTRVRGRKASPKSSGNGRVVGNKIPTDLNLPWQDVPFPSDNTPG